jgi:hypothetical protein
MFLGTRAPRWRQFAAWAGCGASAAFTFVGAFAVGPLAILPTILLAVLATRLGGDNVSAVGVAAGVGAWGFVLGWLNRDGPGEVCTTTATGGGCTQEWSPWPFWLAGAFLVTASVAGFAYVSRLSRRTPTL